MWGFMEPPSKWRFRAISSEIYGAVSYGGAQNGKEQAAVFEYEMPHVAVACPGRFIDFLEKGKVNVHHVDFMVLDEADRLLEEGWEWAIREISDIPFQTRSGFPIDAPLDAGGGILRIFPGGGIPIIPCTYRLGKIGRESGTPDFHPT